MTPFAFISGAIMSFAIRLMPKGDDVWTQAMQSEWEHNGKRLSFAAGCLRAAANRHLKATLYEPVARYGFAALILGWASAKFYAASLFHTAGLPTALIAALILTGLAYAALAGAFIAKQWLWVGAMVALAMILNAAQFLTVSLPFSIGPIEPAKGETLILLAIISEEYFILTSTAFGSLFIWLWQNRFVNLIPPKS